MRTLGELRQFFADDRFALEVCGLKIDEVWDGGAKCSMPLTPAHMNAGHVAQGGAIFTLCDTTFAVAANACGARAVSQSASISYVKPGKGDRLYATAERVSEGRTTCVYSVRVTDDSGATVAFATFNGHRSTPTITA